MAKKLIIHPPIEIEFEGDGCTWVKTEGPNIYKGHCIQLTSFGFPISYWCKIFKKNLNSTEFSKQPMRCEECYVCTEKEGSLY